MSARDAAALRSLPRDSEGDIARLAKRGLDVAHRAVDEIGRAFGIDVNADAPEAPSSRPSEPERAPADRQLTASAFRVIEVIEDGREIFIVTDGCGHEAECATRDMAERVLEALRSKGAR